MYASKRAYRDYFADVSHYVKMVQVLKDCKIPRSNFYKFMKGEYYDHYLSMEKHIIIEDRLKQVLENLT